MATIIGNQYSSSTYNMERWYISSYMYTVHTCWLNKNGKPYPSRPLIRRDFCATRDLHGIQQHKTLLRLKISYTPNLECISSLQSQRAMQVNYLRQKWISLDLQFTCIAIFCDEGMLNIWWIINLVLRLELIMMCLMVFE